MATLLTQPYVHLAMHLNMHVDGFQMLIKRPTSGGLLEDKHAMEGQLYSEPFTL